MELLFVLTAAPIFFLARMNGAAIAAFTLCLATFTAAAAAMVLTLISLRARAFFAMIGALIALIALMAAIFFAMIFD